MNTGWILIAKVLKHIYSILLCQIVKRIKSEYFDEQNDNKNVDILW